MSTDAPTRFDVLIVGTGHGGAAVAAALRQGGFGGSIAMVGEEVDPPYERPALSKDYLLGARGLDRILLRPPAFWRDRGVAMLLGSRIERVDPVGRRAIAGDGRTFGYGRLVWAAGGRPRRLACPGHDLPGVLVLRDREDADRLTRALPGVAEVVVVGGGYIGLETAAAITKLGKRVVLIESRDRLLARVAGADVARFFEGEHRGRGVDIRLRTGVEGVVADGGGGVCGVRLAGGGTIGCGLVVVGIGIDPAIGPLAEAGACCGDGVRVDERCRTTLPHVFAIGDCALHPNRYADAAIRVESVQNATDQAAIVARTIIGVEASYEAVPWFWSDQYDLRLQTVGLSAGHDATVRRGDPAGRSFSIIYLAKGRVVALDCVNRVKDFVQGRELVVGRSRIDPAILADTTRAIKDIVADAR